MVTGLTLGTLSVNFYQVVYLIFGDGPNIAVKKQTVLILLFFFLLLLLLCDFFFIDGNFYKFLFASLVDQTFRKRGNYSWWKILRLKDYLSFTSRILWGLHSIPSELITSKWRQTARSMRRHCDAVCVLGYVFWRVWSCTEQCNREALKSLNLYGLLTAFFFKYSPVIFWGTGFYYFLLLLLVVQDTYPAVRWIIQIVYALKVQYILKHFFCLRVIDSAPWKSYQKVDCLWENRDFHGLWKRKLKIFFHAIAMTMHSKYFFHGQFNIHVFDFHSISAM